MRDILREPRGRVKEKQPAGAAREFRTPHALVFDSQGRLIVADRHNHRIKILTTEGKYIGEYREFSRVSGLTIDKNDTIYAADSESDARRHPGWLKGVRIGSLTRPRDDR